MDELFKPQDAYSKKAMRSVFDRLAHASIMRLNSASMDKVILVDHQEIQLVLTPPPPQSNHTYSIIIVPILSIKFCFKLSVYIQN